MNLCKNGHPRVAANLSRSGNCLTCQQITRQKQAARDKIENQRRAALRKGKTPKATPETNTEAQLEAAIRQESWSLLMPWER